MPTVHILYGQDSFSLREKLRKIKGDLGSADLLDWGTQKLDGVTLTAEYLANVCQAMPFMVSRRVVIVEGLLSRFEPRPAAQGESPNREGHRDSKKEWEPFVRVVKSIPDSTLLILVDGEVKDKNPLLVALSAVAHADNFKPMKGDELLQWTQERASGHGLNLTPPVANHLLDLLGNNLWLIDNELQKLALYSADKTIKLSDVQEIVAYAREASIFQLVDAILQRRLQTALELLHLLRNSGAAAPYILAMLTREVRRLLLASLLVAGKALPPDLARELRLLDDRDLNIIRSKVRKYSLAGLKDLYHRFLETDMAIKTGKVDPDMAIELLIGQICGSTPTPAYRDRIAC